jgi:hypothetical protein
MKNIKLRWKKNYFYDGSDFWYSAKVGAINWEYIVEEWDNCYRCYLLLSPHEDEIRILEKNTFKTLEKAQQACEKHLAMIYTKFEKWVESNSYEK